MGTLVWLTITLGILAFGAIGAIGVAAIGVALPVLAIRHAKEAPPDALAAASTKIYVN